jgi:hypothetical protein
MPETPEFYLEKARKNEAFAHFLTNDHRNQFEDWIITALFYAAIHYVNAVFAKANLGVPSNHVHRGYLVRHQLRSVSKAFRLLKGMSETARYGLRGVARTLEEDALPAFHVIRDEALRQFR